MSTIKSSGKGSWSLFRPRQTAAPHSQEMITRHVGKERTKKGKEERGISLRTHYLDYLAVITRRSVVFQTGARAALHVDVACQMARHPVGSLRSGALFSALPAYNNALGSLSLMDILITHPPTPVSYISPRKIFGEKTKNKFRPG